MDVASPVNLSNKPLVYCVDVLVGVFVDKEEGRRQTRERGVFSSDGTVRHGVSDEDRRESEVSIQAIESDVSIQAMGQ